jgi:Flp pilus assembly protein TadD
MKKLLTILIGAACVVGCDKKEDTKILNKLDELGSQFASTNFAGAEAGFQKMLASGTNQLTALNGLGQLYLSQHKYDDAEKYLLKAEQSPVAQSALARLYLLEGKFDQAEKYAQNLVSSGQADEIIKKVLADAKAKKLSDDLRKLIEPHS